VARKVPLTRFPDAVAVQYSSSMKKLLKELRFMVLKVFDDSIKPAMTAYRNDTMRNDGPLDVIRHALDLMKALSLGIFPSDTIRNITSVFVNGVDRFNRNNMQAQARVKGIDVLANEPWLESFKKAAVAENVSLIKNLKDKQLLDIELIVYQGVKNGQSQKEIRELMMERFDMSYNRAQLIAVDQTGSVLSQMTAKRHKVMGIERFKWSTSKDERVRPRHKELDGKVFDYDDPPSEGMPGMPIRCRCVAIPVFEYSN